MITWYWSVDKLIGQVSADHKYGLLTNCEIKMAGYWPTSFFACLWTETKPVEVHKLAKKERSRYPAIFTEQTWSVRVLSYGFKGNFACGIQRVVQSQRTIWFILPARGASHIMTWFIASIASVSVGLGSKERPRNGTGTVFCPREVGARVCPSTPRKRLLRRLVHDSRVGWTKRVSRTERCY